MKRSILGIWMLGMWLIGLATMAKPMDRPLVAFADSDGDGVPDDKDLCPGTAVGVLVNAYGCPVSLASCDYTTSTVTLASTGGSTGTGLTTSYVLADNTGTILQVSTTPSFSGLSGSATYMALSAVYDGAATNLTVGQSLSAVSASCLDWSDALIFKACVTPTTICDYRVGDVIILQGTGGSSGTGVKTSYVLTNSIGQLVMVSNMPSFNSSLLLQGTYLAYALTYTDDGSIQKLVANGTNTLSQITASCLAVSPGLSLKLCGCGQVCIPIIVRRSR